ncbi:MAG: TIGR03000 domain-containing protein [Planctomycetia bacterium]|nr:TIGR03000 domain-containing protein [Planctomycetia bacterium]
MITYTNALIVLLLFVAPGIAFGQQRHASDRQYPNQPGRPGHHHHRHGSAFVWGFPSFYYGYDPFYYTYNPWYYTPPPIVNYYSMSMPIPRVDPSELLESVTSRRTVETALRPNQARLQVILPQADAELQIDGQTTTSVGSVRNFDTPELDPGMLYTYTVEAMWKSRGEMQRDVRRVDVRAGSRVMVDFTKPATSEAIGKPKTVRSPW